MKPARVNYLGTQRKVSYILDCQNRCNRKSAAQYEYLQGAKYCSICRKFIRTEDTYCFCCEYRLVEYEAEQKTPKVSYFSLR